MLSKALSDKPVIAIAIVIIAVILVGEVVVYTSDYTDYSAEASLSGDVLNYEVSADGSKTYTIAVIDNGSYTAIDKLYLYYDPSYPENYSDVNVSVGAQELDQEYYLEQMVNMLRYRNFHNIEYVDAQGLREMMESTTADGSSGRTGVVVISGALPDTVYTGNSTDVVFDWVSSGGSLYWAGNLIGEAYATADGEIHHVDGYQELFFGAECLNTGDTERAYSEIDNGYRSTLSLSNNQVAYGVDPSLLPADRKSLAVGYIENGFASTTFVGYGQGMICVMGGDYSNYQRNDLVQIIAAGLGPESELLEVETGSVTRGTISGTIENVTGSNLCAYIYLGGYYPVYGKLFEL